MAGEGRARRKRRRDARRAKRNIGTSPYVYRLLRAITSPFFFFFFRPRAENLAVIRTTPRPFIVLGNHSSVIDPFLVSIVAGLPIQYVVSDSQFRNRYLSIVLGLVGSVPKTKAVSDLETVKNIVRIKRERGIIGVFPEGQSSWDGHSLPIVKSTFKLVKSLKVPVVTATLHGAYLAWPRWSPRPRRNRVTVRFERVLEPETLKKMSLDEVEEFLTKKMNHNAFEEQRTAMQLIVAPRLAEYLERVLFICPSCRTRYSLVSRRRRFECTSCGYSVAMDAYGYFVPRKGSLKFDNVRDWNLWQREEFEMYLRDRAAAESTDCLMEETGVRIQRGFKTQPLEELGVGSVYLYTDRMDLALPSGELLNFPISAIEGINVQNNEKLEFYVYDDLYRLTTIDPRGNTYKWMQAVAILQKCA